MPNPLASDLDHILDHTRDLWEDLRGNRIFLTGCTGFFGCWLLESFAWANDRLGLGARAVVLSRDPAAFGAKATHLAANPSIGFHIGDVRSFEYPIGSFSHIVHAATESTTALNERDPLTMVETVITGTLRTLDFATACGGLKVLLTSSGAVYGKQPENLEHVPETYAGAPDTALPRSAYGEGKRVAELLCAIYHQRYGLETKIARCFAFVGPHLPLDAHFAIGNFIRDRLNGGLIRVNGDGTAYRSYLYAADLAIWLWTILVKGIPCRPYNVGSEEALSIAELAAMAGTRVQIAGTPTPGKTPDRYVPSTHRARTELGLAQHVPLSEAIRRTCNWIEATRTAEVTR